MAVLCLLTNTPWPWPTPAGAASARGGFPTLGTERERSGGGVAQRRSAQAKRGRLGCLLSRARDGVPQEAWFPCFARSAERCFVLRVGVAGRKGPLRRVPEDGGILTGCRLGGAFFPQKALPIDHQRRY